jgi:multidrug resistance efflux pump
MYVRHSERSHTTLPASLLRTAVVLALSLLLGVLFVQWLQLRDVRTFSGNVFAQTATIQATRDAEIAEIFVKGGDVVESQQDIVILQDNSLKRLVTEKRREVETLARELDNAIAKSEMDLKWRRHELDREILENRLIASNRFQSTSLKTVQSPFGEDRFKEVSHRRFASDADEYINVRFRQRDYKPLLYFRPGNEGDDAVKSVIVRRIAPPVEKQESVDALERRRLCEARIRELEKMKDGMALRIRQATGVDLCETKHAHALAELEEFAQQATEFTLKTTRSGVVTRVLQVVGSRVRKGEPIVQIMDPRMRHIVVKVPAHEVARFEEGNEVDVIFAGHHKRTARVERIPVEVAGATNAGEPALSVTIVPAGRLWPAVPVGSGVEVRARK